MFLLLNKKVDTRMFPNDPSVFHSDFYLIKVWFKILTQICASSQIEDSFKIKIFFPSPVRYCPMYGVGLETWAWAHVCRYDILVHPNQPVVRSDVGGVSGQAQTHSHRGGRSMIKSHRCCPIGSEQVAVHVWLKDARNDPARIRSADLSVFGLPRYHWATLVSLKLKNGSIKFLTTTKYDGWNWKNYLTHRFCSSL